MARKAELPGDSPQPAPASPAADAAPQENAAAMDDPATVVPETARELVAAQGAGRALDAHARGRRIWNDERERREDGKLARNVVRRLHPDLRGHDRERVVHQYTEAIREVRRQRGKSHFDIKTAIERGVETVPHVALHPLLLSVLWHRLEQR